jgi:predicted metal-dependent phosphoesterase TrpH
MLCDLHLHSHHSDGELSPEALIDVVADAGVELAALTDHDTTAGHAAARRRARERHVRFIGGIEMTSYGGDRVVHVLGLNIGDDDDDVAYANRIANGVFGANQRRWVESLQSGGADISWERDFADHPVRLPVLIERLCLRGVADGDPQRCHAAFRSFFSALPPDAYAGLPSPTQAASIVRAAGGVALLAHPAELVQDGIAQRWLDDIDGLEALYLRYEPDRRSELIDLALRRGKVYSCGSDWHGWFQGAYVNPNFEAPPELLERLHHR